jgi:hypothetical protein
MRELNDLTGQNFGRWTVIDSGFVKNKRTYYQCICKCGTKKAVLGQNLTRKISRSCGCLKVANITSRQRTNPILVTARKVWRRYADGCSFETFFKLSQEPCYYCKSPPSNHARAYTGNHPVIKRSPDWAAQCQWDYNGLDRIDSNKPHTEDNIVPCCKLCNQAKNDLTTAEFKNLIKNIYENFIGNKNETVSTKIS